MGKTIKLGDDVFELEPLSASDAFDLQPILWPPVAEILAALLSLDSEEIANMSDGDADIGRLIAGAAPVIMATVVGVFAKLPPDKLKLVRRTLLAQLRIGTQEMFTASGSPFDLQMRGRTVDIWRLMLFAIQINYPDFFEQARGAVARAKAKALAMLSNSTPGSTPAAP